MSDWRYAWRTLRRSPGFACVTVLSLGLGIGATTAIYSVIRAVLLDPLPVRAPQALVAAAWNSGGVRTRGILTFGSTSYPDENGRLTYNSNFSFSLYRTFQEMAGHELFAFSYAATDVAMSVAGQPVVGSSLLVSGNFFPALGVTTILGRPLSESDDRTDAAPAAVLAYRFWRRALGGDPNVLQRTVVLNGTPFTIVGVAAPAFYGMSKGGPFFKPTDVILPLSAQPLVYTRSTPRSLFAADDRWWLQVMARVESAAHAARLEAALNGAFRGALANSTLPELRDASGGHLRLFRAPRGLDSWTRGLRQPLYILGVVVSIVLLIACVNVGNLMLARGAARQTELSIRLALGCSRWQLVRSVLIESLVLAAAGGALGILVGVWGARILVATAIGGSTRTALEIGADMRLLATTAVISAIAAVLFSALPILRMSTGRIAPVLKQTAAGASVPRLTAGRFLMAAQVAISLPLLVGAALFLRTIYNLGQVELGFEPQRLLIFRLDPSLNGYDTDRIERLYGRLIERLDATPGIESTTVTDLVLISRLQNNWTFRVPGAEPKSVKFARVGPAYFQTLGIPVLAGRSIGVQDHSRAPRVAVVNETAARTLFGSQPAIGQRLTMHADPPTDFDIVGIVKDSRYSSPRDPMPPIIYLPFGQTTLGRLGPMNVIVRSALPPAALGDLLRMTVAEVDSNVPIVELKTQVNQIEETLGTERTFMRLLLGFGAFALLLASIGLHALTAYSVVRRTREIGVRVALGARENDVLWLILRQVVGITVAGMAVGIPGAMVLARFVRASLYGVEPADPASLAAAVFVLVGVAVIAGLIPARRAARLDPLAALRTD
jgi:predicted permease